MIISGLMYFFLIQEQNWIQEHYCNYFNFFLYGFLNIFQISKCPVINECISFFFSKRRNRSTHLKRTFILITFFIFLPSLPCRGKHWCNCDGSLQIQCGSLLLPNSFFRAWKFKNLLSCVHHKND